MVRFRNVMGFSFVGKWCVSYWMRWRVVFTLSTSATALPASAPMSLFPRLKQTKERESRGKRDVKKGEEKVSASRNIKDCFGKWCDSYSMYWRAVFTLSASATALPPSAPSQLLMRLQKRKKRKGSRKKKLGKEKEEVSACENVPRSGSSVVRFRNVKGFFFGEMMCFKRNGCGRGNTGRNISTQKESKPDQDRNIHANRCSTHTRSKAIHMHLHFRPSYSSPLPTPSNKQKHSLYFSDRRPKARYQHRNPGIALHDSSNNLVDPAIALGQGSG